jgi:hypothetical protein
LHFFPSWSSNLGHLKPYYLLFVSSVSPVAPPKRYVHILRSSSPGRVQYFLCTGPARHLRFSVIAAPTFPYPASHSSIPLCPRLPGSCAPRQRSTSSPDRSRVKFSRRRRPKGDMASGSFNPGSMADRLLANFRPDLVCTTCGPADPLVAEVLIIGNWFPAGLSSHC